MGGSNGSLPSAEKKTSGPVGIDALGPSRRPCSTDHSIVDHSPSAGDWMYARDGVSTQMFVSNGRICAGGMVRIGTSTLALETQPNASVAPACRRTNGCVPSPEK